MRYLKYAVVVLVVLAILAAVIHFRRESIVREFANSALSEQGMTITDLSIQALEADYVRLSHLVLEQDDGTRYLISGLSFPLSFPSIRAEEISIGQLVMTPADTKAAPLPLARLLQTFLQLPDNLPNTEITVSRFMVPGTPPVDNIVWQSTDQRQSLAFRIAPAEVTVDVARADNRDHQVEVNATVGDTPDALTLALTIHRNDTGLSLAGPATVDLAPWLPVLDDMGVLPADIVSLDARLAGPVTATLGDDVTQPVPAGARLSLSGEMTAEVGTADDPDIRLRANIPEPIRLGFEYPSLEWTVNVAKTDAVIGIHSIGDIPAGLGDLECRAGIQCTMQASLDAGPLELDGTTIGNAKLSASLTISDDPAIRVDILPDVTLALTGVEAQDFSVTSISTRQSSGAQLTIDDRGWRGAIDHLELVVDSLTDRKSLTASLPVAFNTLHLRDSGATLVTEVSIPPKVAAVSWDGTGIVAPGVEGKISLQDNRVATSLVLSDDEGALSARADATHHLLTGTGTVAVQDATLLFGQRKLSGHLLQWPFAWDVISGTWAGELELNWKTGETGTDYSGTMTYRADELAGAYNDFVFTGLNTTLDATLDSAKGVTISPTTVEVALLDVGLPLERIAANFTPDVGEQSVQVQSLSLSVLGGQLVTDPFRFAMQEEKNDIVLRPRSIQLPLMVDLAEFEDIELSGSVSGVLPVTISSKTATILNGRLESDPPGGVIRYLPGIDTGDAGVSDSALDLVSRALANFQYDSLTSDVNYTENGDLILQMRLTGINPDMDDKQPVILNLNVENNIPQLLRSLRAVRSIEEILERRSVN